MAIAVIDSVAVTPGANGGTTGTIDTTGATLLVIHASSFAAVSGVSDSKGNTWTPLTQQSTGGNRFSRLWYSVNPTVGSGHTFTVSGTSIFCHMVAAAFSGAAASTPFDVENGAVNAAATSLATGTVTPGQDGELLVSGMCEGSTGTTPAIDSGFTVLKSSINVGGVNLAGALAYKVQTTAAGVSPTWSWANSTGAAVTIATFKAAAAGGVFSWANYYYRHVAGLSA